MLLREFYATVDNHDDLDEAVRAIWSKSGSK